ncbi:MAG: hypothetical protein IJ519_00835 [Clostridia bacterium]|nr:hypothetical protein [Clostridia bacterium]
MNPKRITLFAGHYGSGKTNIAVNYALALVREGKAVTVADMDIVNPYFRTKDSAEELEAAGVKLIVSPYANSNVDVPALPQEMYQVTEDKSRYAVLDVGGDDRGALALGRYAPAILEENDYEMLLVINRSRPLTANAADTVEVVREIERACGIAFTGIVNNTNLGPDTTEETVLGSLDYAKEVSRALNIPVRLTTVPHWVYNNLIGKIDNLLPLSLQKTIW